MSNQKVKKITDDEILVKYKTLGVADSIIAQKLGITLEEVQIRWSQLVEVALQPKANGHGSLCTQFHTLALQYNLLGESLKIVGAALASAMPLSEVSKLIVEGDKVQTLKNLSEQCIILHPFTPVDPAQALDQFQSGVAGFN